MRLSNAFLILCTWFVFTIDVALGMAPAPPLNMIFLLVAHIFSLLLDLIGLRHQTDHDKDLEILLLRQQLRILQRKQPQSLRISRWEKLTLVVLARQLTGLTSSARSHLSQVMLLFKPDTLLKWHRELVRRKWTFTKPMPRGRPPTGPELEALILRLTNENSTWGYGKLEGELSKLGYDVGRSTIRDVLKRNRVPPAPERRKHGSSWMKQVVGKMPPCVGNRFIGCVHSNRVVRGPSSMRTSRQLVEKVVGFPYLGHSGRQRRGAVRMPGHDFGSRIEVAPVPWTNYHSGVKRLVRERLHISFCSSTVTHTRGQNVTTAECVEAILTQ